MSLKPLTWHGDAYTLSIRRHWMIFFGLATVVEIKEPGVSKLLPAGAGYHISCIYELTEQAKDYFETFDHWWTFSRRLCDHYCEYYVMRRPRRGNTFNREYSAYGNDRLAVEALAKSCPGYSGPERWELA